MIDAIFPKRPPAPRERDIRPVPADYRPKQLRAAGNGGGDAEGYVGEEPEGVMDEPEINLRKLEDELTRNRLNEIATLVRSLTYGEMMELARAIWRIRPEGAVDQQSLPMMLHLWSTDPQGAELAASAAPAAVVIKTDSKPDRKAARTDARTAEARMADVKTAEAKAAE